MKPLGKGIRAAIYENADKQNALDNLLAAYRSTHYSATGIPPGSFLLRDGNRTDFPIHTVSEEEVKKARHREKLQKLSRSSVLNSSMIRRPDDIKPGDLVLVKRN